MGTLSLPIALGKGGVRALKKEGDGATPIGRFRMLGGFYRPDRLRRPKSLLPMTATKRHYGWCDAAQDRNYNRFVSLPYPASAETLWREDGLYDVVLQITHNVRPRVKGTGSAIFIHVAAKNFSPTQGCIALKIGDLLKFVARVRPSTCIVIRPCATPAQCPRRGLR